MRISDPPPSSPPDSPDLTTAIRTLITGGFILESTHRNPGYAILSMVRPDEFGQIHRYCFAIAESHLTPAQLKSARIAANHDKAHLVLVTPGPADPPVIPWQRFMNVFGGPVLDSSPLDADFTERLVALGHNRLPPGLQGAPDDLYELHVRSALEFLLATRAIRYGQARLFEARPDGIALPQSGFTALFDAKSYSDGYEVTLTTLRQLRDYVDDFSRRYSAFLPRLNTFLLVSGSFQHQDETLAARSLDLIASCGVPITFVTSQALGAVVALLAQHPAARRSLNWSRIFSDPILRVDRVQDDLSAVLRDGILPPGPGASHGHIC